MESLRIAAKKTLSRSTLRKKYRMAHIKSLFDGALPVFVAAVMNRATSAFLMAVLGGSSSTSAQIGVTFAYAFCIAHPVGLFIAVRVPESWKLFRFWFRISIENAGFAWKQTATIIILKWVYSLAHPGFAFITWLILALFVVCIVTASSTAQHNFLVRGSPAQKHVQEIGSEVFALPIAYTFTIVVASLMYIDASASYLSSVDDDNYNSEHTTTSYCFIIYVVVITCALAYVEYLVDLQIARNHARMEAEESQFVVTSEHDEKPIGEQGQPHLLKSCYTWFNNTLNPRGRTMYSLWGLLNTTCGYMVGCAWYTWSVLTFQMLFTTLSGGEILGLFVYALVITIVVVRYMTAASMRAADRMEQLKVQSRAQVAAAAATDLSAKIPYAKKSSGDIGGLRESAVEGFNPMKAGKPDSKSMGDYTAADSASSDGECDGDGNHEEVEVDLHPSRSISVAEAYQSKRGELLMSSARLVVGWSWAEFVAACFAATLPSHQAIDEMVWVSVVVKFVVAAICLGVGSCVELWRIQWRETKKSKASEERFMSVDSNFSVGSGFDEDRGDKRDSLEKAGLTETLL